MLILHQERRALERFYLTFSISPNSFNNGLFLIWHLMHLSILPSFLQCWAWAVGALPTPTVWPHDNPRALIITQQDANWLGLTLKLALEFWLMFGFPSFGFQFLLIMPALFVYHLYPVGWHSIVSVFTVTVKCTLMGISKILFYVNI